MKELAIARTALKRLFRDRSNFFFVFILPIALVLLIGAQFGGGFTPVVGVAATSDRLAVEVTNTVGSTYEIREYPSADEAVLAVERGQVNAALVFPEAFTESVESGDRPEVGFFTQPDSSGQAIRSAIDGALTTTLSRTAAALEVANARQLSLAEALELVESVEPDLASVDVETVTTGDAIFANLGQFDLGASSQLVLFVFLTGLTGSAALIQSRQLGVTRRMLSTTASARTIILGEVLGRWGVAVFQGIYIAIVTLIVFRVDWGNPLGAALIILMFGLVGAAAAMLFGAIFRNDQQAGGISVVAGLGLAALGGSMVPIEIFSPGMQRIAKFTPHAWANEAFAVLVRQDGTVMDILPQLGVLALFSAVLLTIATWRLRTVITR